MILVVAFAVLIWCMRRKLPDGLPKPSICATVKVRKSCKKNYIRRALKILNLVINNDLDKHIQAKTNDEKVRRFGHVLTPLSREAKLNMRSQE